MTAEDILKSKLNNTQWNYLEHVLHSGEVYKQILDGMKDYARQKCEEQRNICSEKGIVFTDADGDQAVITGGDFILNAPEPNFD